jgi:hypothetical protein
VQANARLVDTASAAQIWGDGFETEFADLSELQEHIASAKKAGGHGSPTCIRQRPTMNTEQASARPSAGAAGDLRSLPPLVRGHKREIQCLGRA